MFSRPRSRLGLLAAGAAAAVAVPLVAFPSAAHATTPAPAVVVSGLNNPRQLAIGYGGTLYVAEAGDGGFYKVSSPEEGTEYVGTSGSVTAVSDPATASDEAPDRVVTGLLSAAAANGQQATGSDGVAVGGSSRTLWVQETYFGSLPNFFGNQSGELFSFPPRGAAPEAVANPSAYEAANDPDGQGVDSDPYAVLRQASRELVADAAGNDVLSVAADGTMTTWHVFPNITTGPCAKRYDPTPAFPGCNFVPDALATDGAGHIYVAGLASLVRGQGEVVELNKDGTRVLATYTGLTSPDGVAVGSDGSIYVSELTAAVSGSPVPGLVTRILGSTRTTTAVPLPAGLALDGSGNLYVAAFSIAPAAGLGVPDEDTSGQVWRLPVSSLGG